MNLTRTNIVLAVVAAGLAVPTWLTIQADRTEFTAFEDIPKLFPGFTPDTIAIVRVGTPKEGEDGEVARDDKGQVIRDVLELRRADDEWVIASSELAGVKARPGVVREKVFDHLERIRVDEKAVVREDATPETLRDFGLADDQATVVQAVDAAGRAVAILFVGDDAAGGKAGADVVRGFYVRNAEDSDVVLYEQLYWVIDADRDQWVDRTPLRFEVDQVVQVELHNAKGDVTLTRPEATTADWQKASGPDDVGAVRNAEVRAFVQTLSQIHVQRYVKRIPPAGPQREQVVAEFGLADPTVTASVTLADGTVHRVAVGNQVPGQNEYYMSASSVDFLLAVGDWITSPLERDPTTFFDPPASRVTGPPPQDGDGATPGENGEREAPPDDGDPKSADAPGPQDPDDPK